MEDRGDTAPQTPSEAGAAATSAELTTYVRSLEQDSWLQAERHITAAGFWGTFQWIAGGAAAVLAAAASATAFNTMPVAAGVLALLAAAAAALVTALRPGDISEQHLKTAAAYNALQCAARDLDELRPGASDAELQSAVEALTSSWVDATSRSPRVPGRLVRVSSQFGQRGENYYPRPRWLPVSEPAEPPRHWWRRRR